MSNIKPLPIAHMVDTTHLGGAERMAVNMVNDLSRHHEYEIHLIVSRSEGVGSGLTQSPVQTVCLYKKSAHDFVAFSKFISYLKRNKIRILHAHTNSVYWGLAAKTFFIPQLKLIWHDHYGSRANSSAKFNFIAARWSRMLDGYIGVSELIMGWATNNIGIEESRKIFLPNYPDLIDPTQQDIARFISQKGSPTFLCLGNYREEKDQLLLVQAFSMVLQELPNGKLWLAGKEIQPAYKALVLQAIKKSHLQHHVIDFGECTQVAAIIQATDIGVFASRFEGLPVSLLEFGLIGKPVVATEVGEIPKVLGYGKWGALVAPQQADALAEAMIAIGKNAALQKIWAADFHQFVHTHYSKISVIAQLQSFYNKIF